MRRPGVRVSQCPSSVSPHAVRGGGSTYALADEWQINALGGRADVTPDILDEHYSEVTEHEYAASDEISRPDLGSLEVSYCVSQTLPVAFEL